jgi:hypothetical protein
MKRSYARLLLESYARAAIRVSNLRVLSSTQARADLVEALRDEATLKKQLEDLLAKVEVHHNASSR